MLTVPSFTDPKRPLPTTAAATVARARADACPLALGISPRRVDGMLKLAAFIVCDVIVSVRYSMTARAASIRPCVCVWSHLSPIILGGWVTRHGAGNHLAVAVWLFGAAHSTTLVSPVVYKVSQPQGVAELWISA